MNNEPAFPSTEAHGLNSGTYGITMRDYFAAKAMHGLISQSCGTALGSDRDVAAQYAYEMADAMMKARGES